MIKETEIETFLSYKYEKEWFEFKLNFKNDDELGEYISTLSNSAAYYGKKHAYLICGIGLSMKDHDYFSTSKWRGKSLLDINLIKVKELLK